MPKKPYPEHEKLALISDQSQAIGEFLEWLRSEGILLARWHQHTDACFGRRGGKICDLSEHVLYAEHTDVQKLLARYFKINLGKIETEKRAMLQRMREVSNK